MALRRTVWQRQGALRPSAVLRKKSGKPLETPPAPKQVYLPYDTPPTKQELEAARRKFSRLQARVNGKTQVLPVFDVPENMYTYGKEGMSLPIAIMKDEPDPVIGPEHTYPLIYENKVALRDMDIDEIMDALDEGEPDTPLRELELRKLLWEREQWEDYKLMGLYLTEYNKYATDRSIATAKTGGKAKGPAKGDPDKAKAAEDVPASASKGAKGKK